MSLMIYTEWKAPIYNIPLVALSHGRGDERTSGGVALLFDQYGSAMVRMKNIQQGC